MEKAYKLAALSVRQRFAEQHPDRLAALDGIRKDDVAVYSGTFDQAERVFEQLGIEVSVNPDARKLKARVVYVNCSREYDEKMLRTIGGQVENGVHLVTSDWALHYLIANIFPGTLKWTGQGTVTETISVEPYSDSLWSEIAVLGADPQWWLWGSYPIEVLDNEKVTIEAASHDLLVRYKAPVVAARFKWGRGEVFHVISHFWAKSSATPTVRHTGLCTDFLKAGMRLSDDGIKKVIGEAGVEPNEINFAMIQSAATATELVAQLCVKAVLASA